MEFTEAIKQFSKRVPTLLDSISTEESTKMSLIVPVFQMLGYDVFNPNEFCPEYTADIGIKKGEKVDYAIMDDGEPIILVECKSCTEALEKHASQLFRYFSTTAAKFGILTNGIIYRFYTDLDEANKMDLVPFLEIDMLNLKERLIKEFAKFQKENFDTNDIFSTAEELKYTGIIKDFLQSEFNDPSDSTISFVVGEIYDGRRTQAVIDKFAPLIKKALDSFFSDTVNQRLTEALESSSRENAPAENQNPEPPSAEEPKSKIVTTDEEVQAFHIVRGILGEVAPIDRITYRDQERYFSVLYDDSNKKPICRLDLDSKNRLLMIPDGGKKDNGEKTFEKISIESITDIYKYKDKLIEAVKRHL